MDLPGAVVAGSKLLWPQTEYIEACLARAEWLGDAQVYNHAYTHIVAMRRHFTKADRASWYNQLTCSGQRMQSATPVGFCTIYF
ncbi:MAG: AGE family epimerase/isomerase [Pseudomonadota bacterium]